MNVYFEDVTVGQELGLELSDHARRHENEIEDSKKTILKALGKY